MRLLGDGRTSEVYLAWDESLFCLVVAKLIRPGLVGDPRAHRRLGREVQALTRLSHPMIPRCFHAVLQGERPHFVGEFLEGAPLSSWVGKNRLPLEEVLPVFLRMCSALHYIAGQQMVHLDVKPGNIVLGAHPRLVDFHLARSFEQAARLSGAAGTDPYMAPEQCDPRGRGGVGAAADVWGLGATMYQAVMGRLPFPRSKDFDESDPYSRYPQLRREPDPLDEGLPPPLADLILRCLSGVPSARPIAAQVASELEPLVVNEGP